MDLRSGAAVQLTKRWTEVDSSSDSVDGSGTAVVQLGNQILFPARTEFEFLVAPNIELHSIPVTASGAAILTPLPVPCGPGPGDPPLSVRGALHVGGTAQLSAAELVPGSGALIAYGLTFAGLGQAGGCQVAFSDPKLLPLGIADGSGVAQLEVPIPDTPALLGLPVYLQALVLDGVGPLGREASLTSALELLLGP